MGTKRGKLSQVKFSCRTELTLKFSGSFQTCVDVGNECSNFGYT